MFNVRERNIVFHCKIAPIHVPSPVSRIQCENLLTILRYIGEIILRIFRRSQPLRTSRGITSLIIRFKDLNNRMIYIMLHKCMSQTSPRTERRSIDE